MFISVSNQNRAYEFLTVTSRGRVSEGIDFGTGIDDAALVLLGHHLPDLSSCANTQYTYSVTCRSGLPSGMGTRTGAVPRASCSHTCNICISENDIGAEAYKHTKLSLSYAVSAHLTLVGHQESEAISCCHSAHRLRGHVHFRRQREQLLTEAIRLRSVRSKSVEKTQWYGTSRCGCQCTRLGTSTSAMTRIAYRQSTTVCELDTETEDTCETPATMRGFGEEWNVPWPSWPSSPAPQLHRFRPSQFLFFSLSLSLSPSHFLKCL